MPWKKIGFIFVAKSQYDWMQTHAAWPRAINIGGNIFRIYFSSRDAFNRSHIAFIDLDITNPSNIISLSSKPVLSPSKIGLFDDCGVIPCYVMRYDNQFLMHYVGISLAKNIPYTSFCGLANLNRKLDSATRISQVPLLERSKEDPFSVGATYVCFDEKKSLFHMWYESCMGWNSDLSPRFAIKYAVSDDGVNWIRKDVISIPAPLPSDCISNPSVIMELGHFKMWYSFKTNGKYRIGYAESDDGVSWTRKDDEVGISVSESGWDSEEIEYPNVFDHDGVRYMLYNGNGYGKTGFGLAKIIEN
jgi:predicted GH43/DUF377 family glycosyl hydrolase